MRWLIRPVVQAEERCTWCATSIGSPFIPCSSASLAHLRATLAGGRCEEPCRSHIARHLGPSPKADIGSMPVAVD